jgi:hypothetical protein
MQYLISTFFADWFLYENFVNRLGDFRRLT